MRTRRSRKVTEVVTWVQCFSTYVSVRASVTPALIPELMAYMAHIVRVSQDYAGLAWVRYDAAFRRQAALTGNTKWSAINSTLYTLCFTGLAAARSRCELCFATTHSESECAQRGDPDLDTRERLRTIESAVVAMSKQPAKPSSGMPLTASGEACRKWNATGCSYPRCRYSHTCSNCRGGHPVTQCPARPVGQVQGPTGGHPGGPKGKPKYFPQSRPY